MWKISNSRHGFRFAAFLTCLAVVGQSAACRKATVHDLSGTWEVNYADSKLQLKLKSDGTFEQILQQRDKNTIRRTGTWALTDLEGQSVLLNGAIIVRDDRGRLESADTNGAWVIHIASGFGNIRLLENEDLGLYFDKIHK